LRRRPKEPSVFAVELRSAFVADKSARAPGAHVLIEHQLPRLLQTQHLLKMYGTQSRDRPESFAKGGETHVCVFGEISHAHLFGEVLPDP